MPGKLNISTQLPGLSPFTLGDFWSWAYSDVMMNDTRGAFAEFLVAAALGIHELPRQGWLPYDLEYRDIKIEVKTSAYIQAWQQEKPSSIIFGIDKKRPWDPTTNKLGASAKRHADCYVFCLYAEKDKAKANVLDVAAWKFYVVSTEVINKQFNERKSLSLKAVESMATAIPYTELKARIVAVHSR